MGQPNVRVVVAQGDPNRHGFLRTVLEDDGFDVVGEAAAASQLARLLTDAQPDVVVLDDAIEVSAVQMAAKIVPTARIVVVWPAAVMPIAGAIRVDPSEVLRNLAATVAVAAGIGGLERPEWIERVRKDPATLRELLAARGGVPTRPSVTELQRRGHRLHPSPGSPRRTARRAKPADEPSDPGRRAIVTPLPLAASAAAAAGSTEESWNRRLGVIALGGAAVAGALMIALAFSNRTPSFTAAEPFLPPVVQSSEPPQPPAGGGGQSGGNGNQPSGGGNQPSAGGQHDTAQGTTLPPSGVATTDGGGDVSSNLGGPLLPAGGGTGGDASVGPSGNPGGDASVGPSGNIGGPFANHHLPGAQGNAGHHEDGNHGGAPSSGSPGKSESHNPHGTPPGWQHREDHEVHTSNSGGNSSHDGHSSNRGGNAAAHANRHAHKQ